MLPHLWRIICCTIVVVADCRLFCHDTNAVPRSTPLMSVVFAIVIAMFCCHSDWILASFAAYSFFTPSLPSPPSSALRSQPLGLFALSCCNINHFSFCEFSNTSFFAEFVQIRSHLHTHANNSNNRQDWLSGGKQAEQKLNWSHKLFRLAKVARQQRWRSRRNPYNMAS